MDFRRIPFQFSSTDPAKRQAELQKRFGLPASNENMLVDFATRGSTAVSAREPIPSTNSPRLQHRVPIFYEGTTEPVKSSVDSMASPGLQRKPHVRIVPIEIEGEDSASKRHRSFSGPSGHLEGVCSQNGVDLQDKPLSFIDPPVSPKVKYSNGPRVCNIPIKIEGATQQMAKKPKNPVAAELTSNTVKKSVINPTVSAKLHNGCNVSKVEVKVPEPPKPVDHAAESLRKIEVVLEKLKEYNPEVGTFSGTVKEKKYRYLDEMLTRLMLDLDNIDTMGNEEVRLSRKAAVKQVQASIDLLESRVTREQEEKPISETVMEDMDLDASTDEETMVVEASGAEDPVVSEVIAEEGLSMQVEDAPQTKDIETDCKASESVQMENVSANPKVMEVDESVESAVSETEPIIEEPDSSDDPTVEEPDSSDELKVEAKLDLTSNKEKPELVDPSTDCDEINPVVSELESDSDSHSFNGHVEEVSSTVEVDSSKFTIEESVENDEHSIKFPNLNSELKTDS